jgi:hypothetical protein
MEEETRTFGSVDKISFLKVQLRPLSTFYPHPNPISLLDEEELDVSGVLLDELVLSVEVTTAVVDVDSGVVLVVLVDSVDVSDVVEGVVLELLVVGSVLFEVDDEVVVEELLVVSRGVVVDRDV